MAETTGDIAIIDLPTQNSIDATVYVPVESNSGGTRKYPLGEVMSDLNDVANRAEDAIEAVGDISEVAVPLMGSDVRGGAKLGNGLVLSDGVLSVETLTRQQIDDAVTAAWS